MTRNPRGMTLNKKPIEKVRSSVLATSFHTKFKFISMRCCIGQLYNKFNENPKNTDVLLEICEAYFSDEEYEKAFSLLLDNYYKNKDIVKKKLLEFFEALGNDHDATKIYRKKLSSLLFK